jgi:CheY-like chemotaxis protein
MCNGQTTSSAKSGSVFRPRVLVVDDDEMYRKIIHDYLKMNGYDVNTCEDGMTAMEAMRHRSFAAVITDIFMPMMQGYRLLNTVKQEFPGTPVILISGESPETVAKMGDVSEADAFLRKPLVMADIHQCLTQLGVPCPA